MADFEKKVSLIEVDVDVTGAKKDVDNLTLSIIDQKDAVKANTAQIKALENENKNLQSEVKKGNVTQKEANETLVNNSKNVKDLKLQNASLNDGIKDLNKERRNAVKVTKLQANSLNALRKRSVDLKSQLNNQEKATESGSKAFDKLQKELKETNEQIKELDQGAGDFKTTVGDYPKNVDKASASTKLFGSGLGSLFKAILLNPIGIIVSALVGLIAVFKNSQTGAEFFRKATAVLNTALGKLADVVEFLGAELIEAFSNPKESLDSLIDTIKNGVVKYFTEFIPNAIKTTIEGFSLLGDVVTAIFEGDFDKAIEKGKESMIKLADGITDLNPVTAVMKTTYESLVPVIAEFAKEVNIAANGAFALEEALIANEKAIADQQVTIAKSIQSQKELDEIIKDQSQSYEDRLKASEEFAKIEQDQINESVRLQRERLAIIKAQNNLTNSTEEDIQKVRDAEIKLANLQAESASRRTKNILQFNTIKKQQEKEILAGEEKLESKLKEIDTARAIRKNEQALSEATNEKERLEALRNIAEEDFALRLEQLETQESILAENKTLSEEEKAAEQAEIDFQKEEAEIMHQENLTQIDEDYQQRRLENLQKNLQLAGAITAQAQKAVTGIFDISRNRIEKRFEKSFSNLRSQLENGQITEEEFAAKSESLEKKKATALYNVQLKEFKIQKALDLAQASISTALGATKALALGPIIGPVLAGITVAAGAIQIAAIATKQPPPPPSFARGGDVFGTIAGGNLHSQGGTKYRGEDGNEFEVERDEGIFVTSRRATNPALQLLDQANTSMGDASMFSGSSRLLQEGGAESGTSSGIDIETLTAALEAMPAGVIEVSSMVAGINAESEAKKVGTI